ncbi:hypothetical protein ACFWIO_15020 [Streptomyces diastatochromogenes]|uniref:hypothetical protein n=1 Tax=Streptomyces diastatochromogenes TaxID=42236 RepID=UPI003661AD35
MKGTRRTGLDLTSLLLGLVFGVGTNLLTADPDGRWAPLRAVNRYAAVWLPAGVAAAVAWELGQVAFWRAETGACQAVSRLPLDAHWSGDSRSFVVTGEDHRRYTWSLPDGTDARSCEALLGRIAAELTAEERRRHGLPT